MKGTQAAKQEGSKDGCLPVNFKHGPYGRDGDCSLNSSYTLLHFPASLAIKLGHVACSTQPKWGYYVITPWPRDHLYPSSLPSPTLAILKTLCFRGLQNGEWPPKTLRLLYDLKRLCCIMQFRILVLKTSRTSNWCQKLKLFKHRIHFIKLNLLFYTKKKKTHKIICIIKKHVNIFTLQFDAICHTLTYDVTTM